MPRPSASPSFEETERRRRFGAAVKTLRARKGWTQEKLAEAASGMDRSYLADIEAGRRNPTLEIVGRLADGLGVLVSELFVVAEGDSSGDS